MGQSGRSIYLWVKFDMKILIDGQTLATPEIDRGIGMVFKQICEHLIIKDISKEWFVSIRSENDLRHFSDAARIKIRPILMPAINASLSFDAQNQSYSAMLQSIVDEQGIDIYWNLNPLMINVFFPTKMQNVLFFATIYDLIPWVMKNEYYDKWTSSVQLEYKRRLHFLSEQADQLIFISESAKNDFVAFHSGVRDKSAVIPPGVDHTVFYPRSLPKLAKVKKEKYVLFVGGFDVRKNNENAMAAFSKAVNHFSDEFSELKLYVVCNYSQQNQIEFQKLAERHRIWDRVILTGFVNEEELVSLYQNAILFFFPSLYEGFGLPVLEAMATGLPVVCSNTSSVPEVGGDTVFYCDPHNIENMAQILVKALHEVNQNLVSIQQIHTRAKQFDWNKCAVAYSRLFNNKLIKNRSAKSHPVLRKIAYVSPWIPQRTGIADYSYNLVNCLKNKTDITLFLDNIDCMDNDRCFGLPIRVLDSLPSLIHEFDTVIYHIGNNTHFHRTIYKMAWDYPGIVVLHDYNIHSFIADGFLRTKEEKYYKDALIDGYGNIGENHYKDIIKNHITGDINTFPLSKALAERSQATIVHSRWVKTQFENSDKIKVIPLGTVPVIEEEINIEATKRIQNKLGITSNDFLIATFGFINKFKRIDSVLDAVKNLVDKGYPVKLLLAGEILDPSIKIKEMTKKLNLQEVVILTGYLNDDELEEYLSISDIVLNLRYPSMGETSAILMRALSYGKACIVSNYCQFAELPDSVCWKVDIDHREISQLIAYLEELMQNLGARKQLGRNAKFYMENYSTYESSAGLYCNVIDEVT